MQIVINIDEEVYKMCKDINGDGAIANGTPLPKGHGDLIDRNLALSDDGLCEFHMYDDYVKMKNYLKSIATVIEADKESEEQKNEFMRQLYS